MKTKIKGAVRIRTSPRYSENEKRCKGDDIPCIVCGRPVKDALNNPKTKWLRAGPGSLSEAIPHDTPDQGGGEMGGWPIGPDCLRRHPELQPLVYSNGTEEV